MGSTSVKKTTKKMKHFINWFEIPALNFQRAVAFYNHIYAFEMQTSETPSYAMAFFPAENGIGGAVVAGEGCVPSEVGPLIYLNSGKDLSPVLNRIEDAGGRVVLSKTLINEDEGYFALFIDSEGNRLALHSKN